MMLLIDAGNTRIKWALLDSAQTAKLGEWTQTGSLSHQELIEKEPPWRQFDVSRIVISNVAGHTLRDQLLQSFQWSNNVVEWFSAQSVVAGIKNRYRNPAQLGCDRLASAVAAHALFPGQALIIATCGTALTIDAVTAQGDFIGGMIAPGLQLMAQSLTQNTAQLPAQPHFLPENNIIAAHFADQTQAAIFNGCLAAQAGAIEHAVHEFTKTTGKIVEPLCIISGGAAKYVLPSLNLPHQFVDNLVLIGLQVIASC